MADDQQQPADEPRRPSELDATRQFPAYDDTADVPPPGDETVSLPPADHTAVMPAAEAWSGRAGVPPPPAQVRDQIPAGAWVEPGAGPRRWWLPVGLGLLALLLFGLVGFGLWLVLRDGGAGSTPVVPASTATGTGTGPVSPSVARTTGTPSEDTTEQVVVPRVTGMEVELAQDVLDSVGLNYRLTNRVSADWAPGTVIEVNPPEGTVVAQGRRVTLVIAVAPPSPTAPSPTGSVGAGSPTPSASAG